MNILCITSNEFCTETHLKSVTDEITNIIENRETKEIILNENITLQNIGTSTFSAKGSSEMSQSDHNFVWSKIHLPKIHKSNFKLPHIGWNDVEIKNDLGIFKNIKQNSNFYFVKLHPKLYRDHL